MEGLEDVVILELATMGILYSGRASWLKVGGGVFIPLPENLVVADSFTPESPALVTAYSGQGRKIWPPPGAEPLPASRCLGKHSGALGPETPV